jgi:hypothetical protein
MDTMRTSSGVNVSAEDLVEEDRDRFDDGDDIEPLVGSGNSGHGPGQEGDPTTEVEMIIQPRDK